MILKASQRSGGQHLGRHLLNAEDNEHVEVHEVSGFVSDTVLGAMKEAQAMAMGTRCKQYLFSVSLKEAFARALEERGLYLARGDRRGHVAVTYEGEVFAISRLVGKTAKEVTAKLGKPDDLRSVDETCKRIAGEIAPRLGGYLQETKRIAHNAMKPLLEQKAAMQKAHAEERKKLDAGQKQRWDAETRERAGRLRKGVAGLWDRVTGDYQKTRRQNEMEAFFALQRDRQQRQGLIAAQLSERQQLQQQIRETRHSHARQILELHRQAANYRLMSDRAQGSERGSGRERGRLKDQFADAAQARAQQRNERRQTRERTPERQPERGRELER